MRRIVNPCHLVSLTQMKLGSDYYFLRVEFRSEKETKDESKRKINKYKHKYNEQKINKNIRYIVKV